ncbi:MAG: hypothetical protein HUJ99_01175 [Bacteroidaceae bacterium]|nr:hypothetical protein [Bacteroidaceae bacterium]
MADELGHVDLFEDAGEDFHFTQGKDCTALFQHAAFEVFSEKYACMRFCFLSWRLLELRGLQGAGSSWSAWCF